MPGIASVPRVTAVPRVATVPERLPQCRGRHSPEGRHSAESHRSPAGRHSAGDRLSPEGYRRAGGRHSAGGDTGSRRTRCRRNFVIATGSDTSEAMTLHNPEELYELLIGGNLQILIEEGENLQVTLE